MERFDRLASAFKAAVDSGEIPGASLHIYYDGEGFSWWGGYANRELARPITRDTVFRLASLSKIVTSVAAMSLVERGKLDLADPITRFFPHLERLTVGVPKLDPSGATVLVREAARRPILVHDLMRHTSGFTYGQFADSPVQRAYREAGMASHDQTTDDILRKLAELPLAYQPGTTFEYGMSTDVLGWIVERVAGRDLEDFIGETVAQPLGLSYLGFRPAPDVVDRIAQPQPDPVSGEVPILGSRNFYEAGWLSGGHGLFATAPDFFRFGRMLLEGGTLDGARIIGRKTLSWMTNDHLPPNVSFGADIEQLGSLAPTPANGQGFGLGFAVRTHPGRNSLPGSVGDFSWAGLSGTYFWADPSERLTAVLMMQAPNQREQYRRLLRQLVYSAVS